jgi:hypothetical protein
VDGLCDVLVILRANGAKNPGCEHDEIMACGG